MTIDVGSDVLTQARSLRPRLVALRRHLHRNPERSFQEVQTAARMAQELADLGLEVQTGVGGHGVVGLLRGAHPGRTVAIRADMDALEIHEAATHDYASQTPGVMHACGHDAHMAIVLGAARLLSARRAELNGNVKFMFQPGEEIPPGGALDMLRAGVLENPHVDAVIGLHMYIEVPVGKIALRSGQFLGGLGTFQVDILGKGAGGSVPHRGVDGIAVAAQLITSLQLLISREVNPLGSATLTITEIHGGGAGHVLAERVTLHGTALTLDSAVLADMPAHIEKIVAGVTAAHGAGYEFSYQPGYPPLFNDSAMARLVTEAGIDLLGRDNVIDDFHPVMAADDLAHFTVARPGVCVLIGLANPAAGITAPHHHPRFDIDEDALPVGAAVIAEAARRFLAAG
jgi:amidohydrolase